MANPVPAPLPATVDLTVPAGLVNRFPSEEAVLKRANSNFRAVTPKCGRTGSG